MRSLSLIAAACLAGGLLFLISSCGPGQRPENTEPVSTATEAVVLVSATILTPTPTPSPLPTPSPTPVGAMPIPALGQPPFSYHTISSGETLGYIAGLYGATIEELVAMNGLEGPSALIRVDQQLRVPVHIEDSSPAQIVLPDSEVVYSPAYVEFDLAGFIQEQGGYLATYREYVDNEELTGAEIVGRVAEQFSVGPRLLLALLEYYGGWLTNPAPGPEQLKRPLGPQNPRGDDLYRALGFTANRINAGYYGYKRDGFWIFQLADRRRAITPSGLNAGTVGTQNILAIHSDWESWPQEIDRFMALYRALFGEPEAIKPLVPANLQQPPLVLPWAKGEGFYFTGGPHPAYIDGSGWAAVDFGPPDVLGNCFYSNVPSTAAAAGMIVSARQGEVQLDLDGDGHIQTGWGLFYLHVALDIEQPVQPGQHVEPGDVIGYASCEGGLAESSHVHLARRYNGEWIDAGGPVPMELSGWVVQPNTIPYEGFIAKGEQSREACECWDEELNLIIH